MVFLCSRGEKCLLCLQQKIAHILNEKHNGATALEPKMLQWEIIQYSPTSADTTPAKVARYKHRQAFFYVVLSQTAAQNR